MTRVLVLGREGQLARALATAAWPESWAVQFQGREALDLAQLDRIAPFVADKAPDIVINTAAYTAVDQAEIEPEAACRLNADAPAIMAQTCQQLGALFIHVSTDYVFGATGNGPYAEDAPVSPVNVYGRSKADGETAVLAAASDATVARTAWLMSPDSGFLRAILTRALRGEPLRVVDDQRGSPTRAADLAQALITVSEDRLAGIGQSGLLHVAGPTEATWYDLARCAIESTGLDVELHRTASTDYVLRAQRPRDSRLSTVRLQKNHGIGLPPWLDWVPGTACAGLKSAAKCVGLGQQSGG